VQLTAQGHPRAIFRRAIERRNLLIAEATARELGALDLSEALDLVCLVAETTPDRFDAFARRWLARLAEERPLPLAELDLAITALRALPSARAANALRALL
jgi:beta-phosphoglucomutase-like phosphatase (HAD superfamily)